MKKYIYRTINGILWRLKRMWYVIHKPRPIDIKDNGSHNIVCIDADPIGRIRFIINGSNNIISIGRSCKFYGKDNCIFISGNGNSVKIGENTSFDQRVLLVAGEGSSITIGKDCMFAADVTLRSSDQHPIYDENNLRVNPAKDIIIGDHVWLGAKTVVMKGLTIGGGTMVGYGSMVTKSLPENCLAVGIPAHMIKENISWERTFRKKIHVI